MTNSVASVALNQPIPQVQGEFAARGGQAVRLSCARLTLTDFRCYDHVRLEPGAGPVVLTGSNGAGKTNLLEALSFLVPGTGLRRARLPDVGRRNDGASFGRPWAVAATIVGDTCSVDLGTGLDPARSNGTSPAKRLVHVDGEAKRALAVLGEHFSTHWLTPQMDRLFLDGSQERRRFLDRLVFGFDPAHAGRTKAYTHALRERSKLLADHKMDDAWLSALEDTLATRGAAVAAARLGVAERLVAAAVKTDALFPASALAIDGLAEQWLSEGPALDVEDRLRAALKASRKGDAQTGGTGSAIKGRFPHQSDLLVTHAAKNMPAGQCSTGEQKMLLVGLVLAAARISVQDEGRVPVLLLDEVAAHLDSEHRDALFSEVLALGCQAWFTGTDANLFLPLAGHAKFYTVNAARVCATD